MDFVRAQLAFRMSTLLIHALRKEAGAIKQVFPRAHKPVCDTGIELRTLSPGVDLLRTGLGLVKTRETLSKLSNPNQYDHIIHFGVSGAINDSLELESLIHGSSFSTDSAPTLLAPTPQYGYPSELKPARFYSSEAVVASESHRETLKRLGADAVDMESYAVAEFCLEQKLSWLAIRCISDRAGSTTPEDFKLHFDRASNKLQTFILNHFLD